MIRDLNKKLAQEFRNTLDGDTWYSSNFETIIAEIDADLKNHTGMLRIGNEKLDRWFMMPVLSSPKQIAREILQL